MFFFKCRRVLISPARIWIVNEQSVLRNVGDNTKSTYTQQAENIDMLYPIVRRNYRVSHDYCFF